MASNITQSSHPTDMSSRNIFPFLNLPRELRDMIYDYSLEDRSLILPCHLRFHATNVANTNFLTISPRIKSEYNKLAAKKAVINLYDNPNFNFKPFTLPPAATDIPRVKIHLAAKFITNLIGSQDDISHDLWVGPVVQQLSGLETLSIVINFEFSNTRATARDIMNELNASVWPRFPQLEALQVRDATPRVRSRRPYQASGVFDFSHEDPVVLEWSSRTRRLELVE